MSAGLHQRFDRLLAALTETALQVYGSRLVSLAVFGSVGRGTPRPDSDVDILLVAENLPPGRMARVREFNRVETALAPMLGALRQEGVETELSPVFKTPAEVEAGSPLFLDMVDDARILYDRDGFLSGCLERLRRRLEKLGARRIPYAGTWYWDLKPDYKPGDVIEL